MTKLTGWVLVAVQMMICICFAGSKLDGMGSPSAIPTFESIGITCPFSGDDNFNSICNIEYKVKGASTWKKGHALFTCRKKRQHRGSIVHLKPGTFYEIKITATDRDGGSAVKTMIAKTWSESFPEGKKTTITSQNTTLTITESGTPSAYRVYEGPAGGMGVIDGKKKAKVCIYINANHVIIRRMKLTRPAENAIKINPGRHDIVIEDCHMTQFGPATAPGTFYYSVASGVLCHDGQARSRRIVIQRCSIYNPTGRANSWAEKGVLAGYHPAGPQGISFYATGGHHVIRYNHIYSTKGECYNDGISTQGKSNWSNTDIYGNIVSHCYDDALELESLNENLRVWGNVIHHSYQGIATRLFNGKDGKNDPMLGPLYVWRNLFRDLWKVRENNVVGNVLKMRGDAGYYFYNNTVMKSTGSGRAPKYVTNTDWCDNFIARNNIMVAERPTIWLYKNYWTGARTYGSFLNHNMYEKPRSGVQLQGSWEQNGIFSTAAQYQKVGDYGFALKEGSKGVDAGMVISNFADIYSGSAPDIGACEKGIFEMKVGPNQEGGVTPEIRSLRPAVSLRSASGQATPTRVYNIHGQLVKTLRACPSVGTKDLGAGIYFIQMPGADRRSAMRAIRLR